MFFREPNAIVFDYPAFKIFAKAEMYAEFTDYILSLIRKCIQQHGSFEMHLNLQTFSVTAAQRYSDMIRMFCTQCLRCETEFSKLLTKMYLYNSPRILGSISTFFIGFVDDHVRSKIEFIKT